MTFYEFKISSLFWKIERHVQVAQIRQIEKVSVLFEHLSTFFQMSTNCCHDPHELKVISKLEDFVYQSWPLFLKVRFFWLWNILVWKAQIKRTRNWPIKVEKEINWSNWSLPICSRSTCSEMFSWASNSRKIFHELFTTILSDTFTMFTSRSWSSFSFTTRFLALSQLGDSLTLSPW